MLNSIISYHSRNGKTEGAQLPFQIARRFCARNIKKRPCIWIKVLNNILNKPMNITASCIDVLKAKFTCGRRRLFAHSKSCNFTINRAFKTANTICAG